LSDTENELLGFPFGKHDDIVDTFSLAGIHIAQYGTVMMRELQEIPPEESRKVKDIIARRNWGDIEEGVSEEYV
jgi:hypothetical protein